MIDPVVEVIGLQLALKLDKGSERLAEEGTAAEKHSAEVHLVGWGTGLADLEPALGYSRSDAYEAETLKLMIKVQSCCL